jgi:hypothetical protein
MSTMSSFLEIIGAALLAATGAVAIFEVLLRVEAKRHQPAKGRPTSEVSSAGDIR